MSNMRSQDWDPKSAAVLRDQRAAFDEMRERCPVAYSDLLGGSLFRHEDVVPVLKDTRHVQQGSHAQGFCPRRNIGRTRHLPFHCRERCVNRRAHGSGETRCLQSHHLSTFL